MILLFISDIRIGGVSHGQDWSSIDEIDFISNISPPPEDAEVFFINDSSGSDKPDYIYQLDAYEIALRYSIKTINGYSGNSPEYWRDIYNVTSSGYDRAVYDWVQRHGLNNVYEYDIALNRWTSFSEIEGQLLDETFNPSLDLYSRSTGLMDYVKGEFAWTTKEFRTEIKNPYIQKKGLTISMITERTRYLMQNPNIEPYIKLYVDNKYIQNIPVVDGETTLVVPMYDHLSDEYIIELKTNCYFNMKELGLSEDDRDLSIGLIYIGNSVDDNGQQEEIKAA